MKEIAGHGRRGAAFAADIADEEATSAVFDAIEDRFGHLDVVVHTAGINRPAALADLDLADSRAHGGQSQKAQGVPGLDFSPRETHVHR